MILDIAKEYLEQGYVIIKGVYDRPRVDRLLDIGNRVLEQWRVRPLTENPPVGPRSPYMRHINHMDYHQGRPDDLAFLLDAIAEPGVVDAATDALGEPILFYLATLYHNPQGESHDGQWHKDKIGPVEDRRDQITGQGVQMQIALLPTEDVQFVPGSHLRDYSDEERHICIDDDGRNSTSHDMPGAVTVKLDPGDAVIFHSTGLHRGRYHVDKPRRTLMYSLRKKRCAQAHLAASGLDQYTDQPWFLHPDYLAGIGENTRQFFKQYTDMYQASWQVRLGEWLKYKSLIDNLDKTGSAYPFFES
jgi:hypothetical protein